MELEAYTSCSDSSQNVFYSLILCEKITNEVVLRFGRLVLFFFLSDLVMCSFLCFFLSDTHILMAPLGDNGAGRGEMCGEVNVLAPKRHRKALHIFP